ncbi:chemoreceptor glutamine deamidase CheD [Nitrincola sp. MINF-07-Sa-05]|uniref:chemoreceptor glutamine deamidase CheD n=1 Tax=Nitrincola salilacus TaxID=3400273 RepID=UPI003917D227
MIMERPPQPACMHGFGHINRYWDPMHACWAAKILPGEIYIGASPFEMVTTTLGSCVSACIRDVETGIGGMNHFMLPLKSDGAGFASMDMATRYGNHAMEQLINEIIKHGGHKKNLEVKLTGGGRVITHMSDVGRRNIEFALQYIEIEQLQLEATDLGDHCARKVMYSPVSGRMRVKRLHSVPNDTLVKRERAYRSELSRRPLYGDVELF